jgi:hypothetical protein
LVVVFSEAVDLCDVVFDAFEGASADRLLGDESEPAFDLTVLLKRERWAVGGERDGRTAIDVDGVVKLTG